MTELSKTAYVTKYNDASTGLFRSARPIFAINHRSQVQDEADSMAFLSDLVPIYLTSGDGLAYAGGAPSTIPALGNYSDNGRLWIFYFAVPNTGAITVNIDGIGAVAVKKVVDNPMSPHVDLDAGDIGYGTILTCYFDSPQFICSSTLLTGGGDPEKDVTIESADVLTANATPVETVPAPGSGKYLIPVLFIVIMDFATTEYDTNIEMAFQYDDGTQIIIDSDFLGASSDKVRLISVAGVDGVENSALQFTVNTGNPANGDSDIRVITKYKTITI